MSSTETERLLSQLRDAPDDLGLAGQLVDSAAETGSLAAAVEAYEAMKQMDVDVDIWGVGYRYMLGTAADTVAALQAVDGLTPRWAEDTLELRRQARADLFAGTKGTELRNVATAWTNLGHSLYRTARTHEAYECYRKAYEADRQPVGAGWMAKALNDRNGRPGTGTAAEALAHRLALVAQVGTAAVSEVAGPAVVEQFASLPTERAGDFVQQEVAGERSYEAFIRDNRLYLSTAVDGSPIEDWDSARMRVALPSGQWDERLRQIVAMGNIIKADYLVARRQAYDAFLDPHADAKLYFDTADGARYGVEPAAFRLAMRAAYDCIDRVGSAANGFWELGVAPHAVKFPTVFRHEGQLRPAVLEEYARDNWAVVALVDLAADLEWKDSWLYHYRIWRNRATHQFLRVDPARTEPKVNGGLIDMSFEELSAGALQALQLARSTILSLFQAVVLSTYADRSPNTVE